MLADPDAEVAALAAELLAWFPPDDAAVRALVNIPADGPHALVRASANLTLAYMNRDDSSIDSRLRDQLTSELAGVRLTAAIAMALRSRYLPDAAIDVLTEPVEAAPMAAVPGWSRPLEGFVAAGASTRARGAVIAGTCHTLRRHRLTQRLPGALGYLGSSTGSGSVR